MDKVTKGFVIVACSAVTAASIALIYTDLKPQLPLEMQVERIVPCVKRSAHKWPYDWSDIERHEEERDAFTDRCIKSTRPVAAVK